MNFKQLIDNHSYSKNEIFLKEKIITINIIMIFIMLIFLSFGVIRFLEENYIQAYLDFLLSVAVLFSYRSLYSNKYRVTIISRILIVLSSSTALASIVFLPYVHTKFAWLSMCIYMMFFLLDFKEGIKWVISFLTIVILLSVSGFLSLSITSLSILLITTVLLTIVFIRYEKTKQSSEKYFSYHKKELQEAVEIKTKELKELNENLESLVEKRTQELKIALNAKGNFLANMSHEIRTPLNAIMGFVELLKEEETNKDKLSYLTTINKSSNSLLLIINDILDYSKIESGKIHIEKIDFNSFEEFTCVTDLFKANCKEKSINFIVDIEKNIPKYLNNDIQKIHQIISNLLSNAIKFTQNDKTIKFEVNFQNHKLNISVKDEGIGIPEEKQKAIFEEFSQADISTTRKFGGTGLGLSISNAFVKKLGGTLEVESTEGSGSKFHFSIPCNIGHKTEEILKTVTLNEYSGHILIVEDNKANQMYMKVLLKKMNLTFDIANDGIEAIDIFKKNSYDIILMDENMPNMNGIEATKNIIEYENINKRNHTPIVALTANAFKGDREKFLKAGMDEYLTKPLDKNKLREIFHNFL